MTWLNQISVLGLEPNIVYYFPHTLNVQRNKNVNDLFETEEQSFSKRVKEAYDRLSIVYNFTEIIPGNSVEETVNGILNDR
jgi:thymidylate kinase